MKNGKTTSSWVLIAATWMAAVFFTTTGASATQEPEPGFKYDDYAAVLKAHVNARGMVNYKALKKSPATLRAFLRSIAGVREKDYKQWSKHEKIAFWINAYNGITLKVIIDHYPIKPGGFISARRFPKNSIRQIDGAWDELKFTVMSLLHE